MTDHHIHTTESKPAPKIILSGMLIDFRRYQKEKFELTEEELREQLKEKGWKIELI